MLQNINSKYVLNLVFKYMRNKKKLTIVKHNKEIMKRLDIKKDDFIVYDTLKEFNNKYNTNIKDIDIKILDLIKI